MRMGPDPTRATSADPRGLDALFESPRWRRLALPQQLMLLILPVGTLLALVLTMVDSVPVRAATAAQRLGVYEQVSSDVFGVHPWTWAHLVGWMALAFAVALVALKPLRALLAGAAVFLTSLGLEYAQSAFTDARGYSTEDVWANGVGVALGTALAIVAAQVWARVSTQPAPA